MSFPRGFAVLVKFCINALSWNNSFDVPLLVWIAETTKLSLQNRERLISCSTFQLSGLSLRLHLFPETL